MLACLQAPLWRRLLRLAPAARAGRGAHLVVLHVLEHGAALLGDDVGQAARVQRRQLRALGRRQVARRLLRRHARVARARHLRGGALFCNLELDGLTTE